MSKPEKIRWEQTGQNCFAGYLKDVKIFALVKYSQWDTYRKNLWQLHDTLHNKGEFPCMSKNKGMKEAQDRVDYVHRLTSRGSHE